MKSSISREELFAHAYDTAEKYGLASLSVRGLATECDVSVGTIYNYFSSKTELTTATAELFFKRAFFEKFCHPSNGERYLDYCVRMFESMVKTLEHFRIHWLKGADSLPAAEKAAAHLREEKSFGHIRDGLITIFENDAAIRPDRPECLSAEAVSEFTLRNVLAELRSEKPDCSVLFAMLSKALYEEWQAPQPSSATWRSRPIQRHRPARKRSPGTPGKLSGPALLIQRRDPRLNISP